MHKRVSLRPSILIGLLSLTGFAAAQSVTVSAQNPAGTRLEKPTVATKTITLLHFNDLHAHLTTHADVHEQGGQQVLSKGGGLARLKTLVDSIRAAQPDTLLFNVGDTYHGGVEAFYSEGNDIVGPVNAIGFDVGVPGNWDFGYGPIVARKRFTNDGTPPNPSGLTILKPNFPHLAGNVTYASPVFPFNLAGRPFLPASTTFVRNGIKIGVIGITSDIVPRMHPQLSQGLSFLQGRSAYLGLITQEANLLRNQGSNLVVVLSELGIHKDTNLADGLPQGLVDVFFSAHTHELTRRPYRSQGGALVVEAGNDTWLGRMDARFGGTQLLGLRWSVLRIDESLSEDPALAAMVAATRAPYLVPNPNLTSPSIGSNQTLTTPIDQVLAQTATHIDRRHALENSFNDTFTDTLRAYAGSDVAMTPGFRFGSVNPGTGDFFEDNTVASGDVTIEDVYRFIPVPYTMAGGSITGSRLREIIESNATSAFSSEAFDHSGGWLDGFSGLTLGFDLDAPNGAKLQTLQLSGTGANVLPGDLLSIAGCTRPFDQNATDSLCSYDGLIGITALNNPSTGQPWTSIDFLSDSLSGGAFTGATRTDVSDTSGRLFWPDGPWLQPAAALR